MSSEQGTQFPQSWPHNVSSGWGPPELLCGIRVYWDFNWIEEIGHRYRKFPNCKALSREIRNKCRSDKRPALLLTIRDAADCPKRIKHGDESIFVVSLAVLRNFRPNAGESLLSIGRTKIDLDDIEDFEMSDEVRVAIVAANLTPETVRLIAASSDEQRQSLSNCVRTFCEVAPTILRELVDANLDLEAIRRWKGVDLTRAKQLAELLRDSGDVTTGSVTTQEIVEALEGLAQIDPALIDPLQRFLKRVTDTATRTKLVESLIVGEIGLGIASEAIGARLSERLAAVQRTAEEYSALVENPGSTETQLHEFIKAHPWLVGLDYTRVRSKQAVIRGAVDFLLERYDGFHDLLELKGPAEPIIAVTTHADPAIPSSPHSYSLSPALAQALAQAHAYREQLTGGEAEITRWYGIDRTRNPRTLIVIGREKAMADHAARVLHQLNLSLHRVEIVPYDQLGKRAMRIVDNVTKLLVEESPESQKEPRVV